MASRKFVWVEDIGAGKGKIHEGNPVVDNLTSHVHYLDYGGQNRILVGQGSPGAGDAPAPILIPEENFIGRQTGGAVKALRPEEVMEILGLIQGNTEPTPSLHPVVQLWQHEDDTNRPGELFFYDTHRSKWLSVVERCITFWSTSATVASYLLYQNTITSDNLGKKMYGKWTIIGAEMSKQDFNASITAELRATSSPVAGSAQTIGAGTYALANDDINIDISTANPVLASYMTATTAAAGQDFFITWKLRRRPSA